MSIVPKIVNQTFMKYRKLKASPLYGAQKCFWPIVLIKNSFFSVIFYSLLDFCIFACWRMYVLGLYLHLSVFWEDPFIHWCCAHVRFSSLNSFLSGWYPFNCVGLWLSALYILQCWTFSGNSLPENISPVSTT